MPASGSYIFSGAEVVCGVLLFRVLRGTVLAKVATAVGTGIGVMDLVETLPEVPLTRPPAAEEIGVPLDCALLSGVN